MREWIVTAPFDPITQAELQWIRTKRTQLNADRIVVKPIGEGTASLTQRQAMVKRAIAPYRHLSLSAAASEPILLVLPSELLNEEQQVREGRYDRAARGICTMLAECGIYFEESVNALCRPNRAAHSRSVAAVCRELAHAHHLDEEQAWKAGILHDITKAWSDEAGRALLEVYEPDKVSLSPKVYHSFTAPVFLKTVMGIQDEAILHAIRTHTLGDGHTALDQILYIADKIEPTRGYDTRKEMALAEQDLNVAFKLVLKEAEEYRERRANG